MPLLQSRDFEQLLGLDFGLQTNSEFYIMVPRAQIQTDFLGRGEVKLGW